MKSRIPQHWKWLPFESLLSEPLRNGIYKKKEFHGRGTPIINMGELFGYPRFDGSCDLKRVELTDKELNRNQLACGDLIFARRSLTAEGAGKCSIIRNLTEPTGFESSIIRARLDQSQADPEFFYYLFNSPFGKWLLGTILRQVAVSGITGSDLAKLEVPVPPICEQSLIAKQAISVDDKVAINIQINHTLEYMAQAIFKSWFVDFDPVKAKMKGERPEEMDAVTASLFPEKLVESELGLIPEGWKVKKIGDVVERYSVGKKYSKKTAVESGLVPILDQGKSDEIGFHNDKPGVKASLDDPMIVFANHTCHMKLVTYDFSVIQNVFPFKLNGCDIYWSYMATRGKQEFIEYKGHWPDFMIHEIVIPRDDLMRRFGAVVKPFYSQMATNDKQNKSLAQFRDTLLPKLLSGEIEL